MSDRADAGRLGTMLAAGRTLLADGATGTSLFAMGLTAGEAPERWNLDHPQRIARLHRGFVEAGADIVLTNTFGANARRLALHGLQAKVAEINRAAARIAREVADESPREVVVAGSVGPTGDLFEPLGPLTTSVATEVFEAQMGALREGGVDVAWIETFSALEEIQAAVAAAATVGLPCVFSASFDTAGRTMMGVSPRALAEFAATLDPPPLAIGANCGVGASDLVMSVLGLSATGTPVPIVAKANAGVPRVVGAEVCYSATPELMGRYAQLAADAGARIVGGCCGTAFEHLAAMRAALDAHVPGPRPDRAGVEQALGELQAPEAERGAGRGSRGHRGRP